MGCCLSTGDHHSVGGAPPTSPPAVLELEETVKEVLPETATVVPKFDERANVLMPLQNQAIQADSDPHGEKDDEEIISDFSEICSCSNRQSTAQGKNFEHGDGAVNQKPPARTRGAPAGVRVRARSGDRAIGWRAAGAPSTEKSGQVAHLRSTLRGRQWQTAMQTRNVADEEYVPRRQAGEGSRRRSKSPVSRGDGKSPLVRKGEPPNDVVPEEETESLENPVVSLECFIFL